MAKILTQNTRLNIFIFLIVLILLIGFFFREDFTAEVKDMLNIRPEQYYGVTVDMSQILPESEHYVTNNKGEDLIDISAKLGINTFRITNITSPYGNKAISSYSHEQWKKVLNKMRRKGMHAVILVEGNNIDKKIHDLTLDDYYIKFVKDYIVMPKACSFSNVLAVDIRNEPLINENNLKKLKQASELVKLTCPKAKITVGSWRTDSGEGDVYNWHDPKEVKRLNDIVDIHSVHIYGFDKQKDNKYPDPYQLTTGYLNEIRKYTDKPILIEEFGAGNGSALTDQNTLGSEDIQKKAYEGVLKAMYDSKNREVLGAIGYLLYQRSDNIDSWTITKDKANTLLPAAYTFKEYSK